MFALLLVRISPRCLYLCDVTVCFLSDMVQYMGALRYHHCHRDGRPGM